MLLSRRMYQWRLLSLMYILTKIFGLILCSSQQQLVSNSQKESSNDINEDQLIAEESKRYYSTLPYVGTSTNNKVTSEKDIYKKSATEYWQQNELSESSLMNHLQDHYNNHYRPQHSTNSIQPADYLMTTVNQGYLKGKEINIAPEHKPITLHYRTHAQPIIVHQTRLPGPKPEVKHTTSQEEPQRVVHEVIRPIIQEVHEIIQPYRRVVQQVQPVIEEVRTIIAKDAGKTPAAGVGTDISGHSGTGPYASPTIQKNANIYHTSASSNELLRQMNPKSFHTYKKNRLYENEDDSVIAMAANNQNQRIIRSRVYLTPKGIPVYQSNYRPPIYLSA